MTRVRGRSREPQEQESNDTQTDDWMQKGQAGRDRGARVAKESQEKRKNNYFRFRLQKDEDANIVILDETINDVRFFFEHNLPGPDNKYTTFEPCAKEFANCPLCDGAGQKADGNPNSYYGMYLSVIDTRGFTRKTGEGVDFDRKILCVKSYQHQDFLTLFDACMKQHGTIRGMEINLHRDSNQNTPNIGKPRVMDDGMMYAFNTEAQMYEDFSHEARMDSTGKVTILKENEYLEPFDYLKIFHKPDAGDLRRRYGGQAVPGSAQDNWDSGEEGNQRPSRRRRAPTTHASEQEPTVTRRRGRPTHTGADAFDTEEDVPQ